MRHRRPDAAALDRFLEQFRSEHSLAEIGALRLLRDIAYAVAERAVAAPACSLGLPDLLAKPDHGGIGFERDRLLRLFRRRGRSLGGCCLRGAAGSAAGAACAVF